MAPTPGGARVEADGGAGGADVVDRGSGGGTVDALGAHPSAATGTGIGTGATASGARRGLGGMSAASSTQRSHE